MIRVNLAKAITTSAGQGSVMGEGGVYYTPGQMQQLFVVRFIMLLIMPLALYFYESYNIPILNQEIATVTAELDKDREFNAKRDKSVKEITKFKEEEERVKRQIKALEDISRARMREIHFIDLVQQVIPMKAWLTKLTFINGRANLNGLAMSEYEVQMFAESLQKSAYVSDVTFGGSTEELIENVSLRNFDLSCGLEKINE